MISVKNSRMFLVTGRGYNTCKEEVEVLIKTKTKINIESLAIPKTMSYM